MCRSSFALNSRLFGEWSTLLHAQHTLVRCGDGDREIVCCCWAAFHSQAPRLWPLGCSLGLGSSRAKGELWVFEPSCGLDKELQTDRWTDRRMVNCNLGSTVVSDSFANARLLDGWLLGTLERDVYNLYNRVIGSTVEIGSTCDETA